jgi:pimeloyl-ACP methyl ester carboxylesterase
MSAYLPLIKIPTLIFWGEQDTQTPLADGKKMQREIPDAGIVILSPAGHYSYLDQLPTFLRTLIYFMEH